jgi:hypothetical protein
MAYAISKWDKYCVYHFSWLKKKDVWNTYTR